MADLQNLTFTTTTPITLARGDISQRTGTATGQIRYNTITNTVEHRDGSNWVQLTPYTKQVFGYTGANQTLTIPAGVSSILVKCWGAGGGAGSAGGWYIGSPGGGGGFMKGVVPVTAGENLIVVVGQGGIARGGTTSAYGGGGRATGNGVDNQYGGGGGGYSGIFRTSVTQANALIIAGGGGGGGSSRTTASAAAPQTDAQLVTSGVNNGGSKNHGGAGGGLIGKNGLSAYDNKPLYAGQGGRIGVGAGADASSDGANTAGGQGALQGGNTRTNSYGGGGGGGFWGGSGGGYSESYTMAGGGGGCGFFAGTTIPVMSAGGYFMSMAGEGLADIDYVNPIGMGGLMNTGGGTAPPQGENGGNGRVVVYFYI